MIGSAHEPFASAVIDEWRLSYIRIPTSHRLSCLTLLAHVAWEVDAPNTTTVGFCAIKLALPLVSSLVPPSFSVELIRPSFSAVNWRS